MALHSRLEAQPPPLTWQERLDLARTQAEVRAAARDFLAIFTPQELESLPSQCRPPLKLVDDEDIASYAFDLLAYEAKCGPDEEAIVQKLARFFSHASIRLSQLSSRRQLDREARR